MGVNGLWKLLEPSGKPVPVETLENKVLAVDVSIWLHQLTKGTHDSAQNAYLIGLYHRICKLLFFRIKPVFVFDGGAPQLKKQTIAQRKGLKSKAASNVEKVRSHLLKNLLEQQLVNDVLGKQEVAVAPPLAVSRDVDMFELPPTPAPTQEDEDVDSEPEGAESRYRYADLHSVDINSPDFRSLPPDMRHEILTELLAQRKLSSWHKMHEMPQESDNFSSYQMERLLKRRAIQKKLDETAGELGEHVMSLGELESQFIKEGVLARRVASSASERVVYHSKEKEAANKDAASSSRSQDLRKVDDIIEEEERDILEMIRRDEENEVDYEEEEEEKGGRRQEDRETLKITREVLEEQQKILDSLVKKKAKVDVVEIAEESNSGDFVFDESEMIEQSQILASIQQRNKTQEIAKSLEISVNPSKAFSNDKYDIFSDVFKTENKPYLKENSFNETTTSSTTGKKESKLNKVIEIVIDPNKIKIPDANDVDIFSDVFAKKESTQENIFKDIFNSEEVKDDEDVLMSDTSSESSGDAPAIANQSVAKNEMEETPNDALVKEIFDDVDEASGNDDELMSDSSDTSVEDLTKVCDFLSETKDMKKGDSVNNLAKNSGDKAVSIESIKTNTNIDKVTEVPKDERPEKSSSQSLRDNVQSNIAGQSNLPVLSISEPNKNLVDPDTVVKEDSVISVATTSSVNSTDASPTSLAATSSAEVTPPATTNAAVSTIKDILSTSGTSEPSREHTAASTQPSTSEASTSNENSNSTQPSTSEASNENSNYFQNRLSEAQKKKLLEYQSTLERDRDHLLLERGKQTRLAATITEQMAQEAQELLRLFGVPYIVAPGEAEAQCACLELSNQTQGNITDDSDIWLFGASTVYKNFFDKKSHVLRYTAPDIRYYFELTREKLIQLALLVGSDYTPGLQGVGPVTALEILAKFSSTQPASSPAHILDSMRRFKTWLRRPKPDSPLSRKLRNVTLNDDFPNPSVVEAYLKPEINSSAQKLSWGTPDLDGLRRFAATKFGWGQSRVDQTLIPVMKKIKQGSDQPTLDMFYKNKVVIPKRPNPVSKRVQSAVDKTKSKRFKEEIELSESDSD